MRLAFVALVSFVAGAASTVAGAYLWVDRRLW